MPDTPTKTAIVTGASRGIGAAIAERLARDGFAVLVNYAGRRPDAEAVVRRIESGGGRAIAVQADVADPVAVAGLFDAAEDAFGGVDVLVNNAAVMTLSPLAEFDDATFDRHIAINLKGVFNGLREAARRLRAGGRIVSLSSGAALSRPETYGVYSATKAAVEALTMTLAKEMRGRSITVNAVAPGPVSTDMFLTGKSPELIEEIAKRSPFERIATPEEIASCVSFLAGPDGGWVNGQTLRANGGVI